MYFNLKHLVFCIVSNYLISLQSGGTLEVFSALAFCLFVPAGRSDFPILSIKVTLTYDTKKVESYRGKASIIVWEL